MPPCCMFLDDLATLVDRGFHGFPAVRQGHLHNDGHADHHGLGCEGLLQPTSGRMRGSPAVSVQPLPTSPNAEIPLPTMRRFRVALS